MKCPKVYGEVGSCKECEWYQYGYCPGEEEDDDELEDDEEFKGDNFGRRK